MSPYALLQEIYQEDKWKMLVCCIFLNLTQRKQVDQIRDIFFELYPTPHRASHANYEFLKSLLTPLGLSEKRAKTIIRFSKEWLEKDWKEPIELYGIGKYGQDSWEIFQKGNLEVEPKDGVLIKYLNWKKTQNQLHD